MTIRFCLYISASGEPDYVAQNLNITFSHENAEQTVMIGIFDDTYLELNETFNCTLSLVTPNDPSIRLNPAVATVTIINDDSEFVDQANSYCNRCFSDYLRKSY